MKKLFVVPLILAFLLMLPVNTANADVWARGVSTAGGWFDAEKDSVRPDDELLCWAATAANVLAWSGWDAGYTPKPLDGVEDSVFDFFVDEDPVDAGGWMDIAWQFWFDGTQRGGHFGGSSHTSYYSTAQYTANYHENMNGGYSVLDDIAALFQDDYGVGISVFGNMAHAVTVWGLETDAGGNYTGIWLTDSDNNMGGPNPRPNTLDYHGVTWSGGAWHLDNFYSSNDNYIWDIQALKFVPAPGALLLGILGLGAAGLKLRKHA